MEPPRNPGRFNRADYQAARDELVAHDALAWRYGGIAEQLFPTVGQIERRQTFADAVAAAGLEHRPATRAEIRVDPSPLDLVVELARATGRLPTKSGLRAYAARRHVPLGRKPPAIGALNARAVEILTEQGVSVGGERIDARAVESLALSPLNTRPVRNSPGTWSLDRCLAALVVAAHRLAPRAIRMTSYRHLATGDPDLPSPSRITAVAQRHGTTFSELARRAEAIAAAERST